MKILITGAGGLVGRYCAKALSEAGYQVSGLSRNPKTASAKNPGLENYLNWIEGDILDITSLEQIIKQVDVVVHAAGLVSFQPSERDELWKTNAEGTANVVNACLAAGNINKLVHISSVACLSPSKPMPSEVDERQGFNPDKYASDYASSKYAAEMEVCRAVEEGLPAIIFNPSIVLAPGRADESSAALLHYAGKERIFYPSGWINYVDARDLARLVVLAVEKGPEKGERMVISGGCLSYFDFFKLISERKGIRHPLIETGPLLSSIAWRAAYLLSLLTSKKPLLTRFTAQSASKRFIYKGIAFAEYFGDFNFRGIEETLDWIIDKKS